MRTIWLVAISLVLAVAIPLQAAESRVSFFSGKSGELSCPSALGELETHACRIKCEAYYQSHPSARTLKTDEICRSRAEAILDQVRVGSEIEMALACLDGALQGVLEVPDMMKAYAVLGRNVAEYLGKKSQEGIAANRAMIDAVSSDPKAKLAVARLLLEYREKDGGGNYRVGDEAILKDLTSVDSVTLLSRLQMQREAQKRYCSSALKKLTEKIQSDDTSRGEKPDEILELRYKKLAQSDDADCIGVLGLTPPVANHAKPTGPGFLEELGVFLDCHDSETARKLACMEVVKLAVDPLMLIPYGGWAAKGMKTAGLKVVQRTTRAVATSASTSAAVSAGETVGEVVSAGTKAQKVVVAEAAVDPWFKGRGLRGIPKAAEADLPADFVDAVLADPTVKMMQAQYGTGRDLAIVIPTLVRESGEGIQSHFVAKTLEKIFPDAWIADDVVVGRKKTIRLEVKDSAEAGQALTSVAKEGTIEMAKTKMANPGPENIPKPELRSRLGLDSNQRVISLNSTYSNNARDIVEILQNIKNLDPDVVVVSSGKEFILPQHEITSKLGPEWQVINLSDMGKTPLKPGTKYVVRNDTRGLMYAVYGTADLNITAGAVNLSEPILAGTPTVFFDSASKYRYGYDKIAYDSMANSALATGGATSVTNFEQMTAEARRLLEKPAQREVTPPWRTGEGDQTPVKQYLKHLNQAFHTGRQY